MSESKPKFQVGQLIRHKLFHYHGVVMGVDSNFQSTEEWYDLVAKSRPPKDKPWYHVMVTDGNRRTYVAERHLEGDPTVLN